MTHVPRRLYRQVTNSNQKQDYVFVENNAIVPVDNSIYVIYHKPTKRSFRYDQKKNKNIPTN